MSEGKSVSRRGVLSLAGGSMLGAAAAATIRPAEARDQDVIVAYGELINERPLPVSDLDRVRGPQLAQATDTLAKLVTTVPRVVLTNQPMAVMSRVEVPAAMIGLNYIIRVTMLTDTSDQRIKIETDSRPIPSEKFEVQVSHGGNLPVNDWNLIEDRIQIILSSFNVTQRPPFSLAPQYEFKVLNG